MSETRMVVPVTDLDATVRRAREAVADPKRIGRTVPTAIALLGRDVLELVEEVRLARAWDIAETALDASVEREDDFEVQDDFEQDRVRTREAYHVFLAKREAR